MLPKQLSFRKLLAKRFASTDWFCNLRYGINVRINLYNKKIPRPVAVYTANKGTRDCVYTFTRGTTHIPESLTLSPFR